MAFQALAFVLLATFIFSSPSAGYDLNQFWCETCDCPPPQGMTNPNSGWQLNNDVIEQVWDGDGYQRSVCYCVCGKKLGGECQTRYDCQEGLFCSDRSTISAPGYCRTKCGNDPEFNECHLYERCVPTQDGSPYCERMIKQCASWVYFPVCANDGNRNVTFVNRCFMELHNIELRDSDLPEFQHQVKGACPGDVGKAVLVPYSEIIN